ncbi:hypothetical protein [Spirulina sp. 06S082]|uniref:slr1957 family protein n=1 Tax=Spirulina sp. 06S082 TaxID=3110248 RepID=UPI002B21C168|nr:hypothetical protein [Spirulina sp. 06S082]MEA5470613.1 hypothetical protein [Spirulina sp. 06S082]
MRHYQQQWIDEWCMENGWTDLYRERSGNYWAFPPHAVMPEPIPSSILKTIKSHKGWCREEQVVIGTAVLSTLGSIGLSFFFKCPIPMVFAFGIGAIASALLEMD